MDGKLIEQAIEDEGKLIDVIDFVENVKNEAFKQISGSRKDPTKPYPNEYVHGAQKPSVGRIVHLYFQVVHREWSEELYDWRPFDATEGPFAATVARVNADDSVNLGYLDAYGIHMSIESVVSKEKAEPHRPYWTWPPKV